MARFEFETSITADDYLFNIHVYERTEPLFQAYEIEDSGPHFGAESWRQRNELGNDSEFRVATRVYVGGPGWDALIATPMPRGEEKTAWDAYYDAKIKAFAVAIDPVARRLDDHGILMPMLGSHYMWSIWAGCITCGCSGGFVCRSVIRKDAGSQPLDISVHIV